MKAARHTMKHSASTQVEVLRAEALGESELARWVALRAANPALSSPFFAPEFALIASAHVPDAHVAIFHDGGEIKGFFPFQRRGRKAQPLAAPMNDYHGLISAPDAAMALEALPGALRADSVSVGAWVGEASTGQRRRTLQVDVGDNGFDGWMAERREVWPKYFKDKARARRGLERDLGEVSVRTDVRDPALLDQLIAMKREQYGRTGRHDVFACGWTRDVLHALMREGTADFAASMAVLWAGDTLVALEYALHQGAEYHFWFPAYVPEHARCSPGILLSMETMAQLAPQGCRVFDFGFEGEGYKKYFCNAERSVSEAVVRAPGLRARAPQIALSGLERVSASLSDSVQRRLQVIEACEVSAVGRLGATLRAARDMVVKRAAGSVSA